MWEFFFPTVVDEWSDLYPLYTLIFFTCFFLSSALTYVALRVMR